MKLLRLVFCALITVTSLTAQNQQLRAVDSLLLIIKNKKQDTLLAKNLNLISQNYIYQNSEQGIIYADKALQLSEKLSWKSGIGEALLNIGTHEISKGNYADSERKLAQAKNIFIAKGDRLYIAKTYNQFGILKANQAKYPESLYYFFKSLQLFESINTKDVQKSIGSCYENVGTIYNLTNGYDKAIENYTKAIQILSKINDRKVQVAIIKASIGTIYQKKNELKKAIESYKIAEKELANADDNFAFAFLNSWMGSAYLLSGEFDLSIQKSKKALEYLTKIKDKELISSTTQNLGYAEFKKGILTRNNSSIENGREKISASIDLYKELGNHEGIMKSYLYLSEYYTYKKSY